MLQREKAGLRYFGTRRGGALLDFHRFYCPIYNPNRGTSKRLASDSSTKDALENDSPTKLAVQRPSEPYMATLKFANHVPTSVLQELDSLDRCLSRIRSGSQLTLRAYSFLPKSYPMLI